MKLELKYLTPYLPYGLWWVRGKENTQWSTFSICFSSIEVQRCDKEPKRDTPKRLTFDINFIGEFKPILRPLSDMTQVEYDDFKHKYSLREIEDWNNVNPSQWSYECMVRFFEMHIDVFGLIEKGLAVDINTLD